MQSLYQESVLFDAKHACRAWAHCSTLTPTGGFRQEAEERSKSGYRAFGCSRSEPRSSAGTGEQLHTFLGKFARHLAQLVRPLVMDIRELKECHCSLQLRHSFKSHRTCSICGLYNIIYGDFEDVISFDDIGYEISFCRGRVWGCVRH